MPQPTPSRLALLPLLALAGCPKLGDLGGVADALDPYMPKVSYSDLSLRDIDWEQAEVDLVFDVTNPNPLKVSLASLSYALELEGNSVLSGDKSDGLDLPAEGQTQLTVPLTLVFADIASLLSEVKGKDELGFELSGNMGFDTPVGVAKVPYDASGKFPVLRTPRFSFEGVRVGELAVLQNKASIEVDLGVENRGENTLSFADFDYTFSLKGTEVASGTVADLGDAAGNATSTLTLPIDLQLTSLGSSIVDLIKNKGSADAGLTATMDVTTPWGELPLEIDESGKVTVK